MIFGFLVYLLDVPPWSLISSTLFAGQVCCVWPWLNSRPSVGSQIGLFFFKSTIPYVTANFSVHYMYEGSSVQDEFRYSVFIACRVN